MPKGTRPVYLLGWLPPGRFPVRLKAGGSRNMPEAALKIANVAAIIDDPSTPLREMEIRAIIRECRSVIQTAGRPEVMCLARSVMGSAFRRLKQYPEALHQYEEAAKLQPLRWEMHNNVGAGHMDLNRFAEALQAYQRANEINPGEPLVLGNMSSMLKRLGHPREALVLLQGVLQKINGLPEGHLYTIARQALDQGLEFESVEVLGRLLAQRYGRKMGTEAAARFIMEFEQPARDEFLAVLTPEMRLAIDSQFQRAPFVERFGPWVRRPEPERTEDPAGESDEDVFESMRASRARATAAVLAEHEDDARG